MHFTSLLVATLAGSAYGHIAITKPAPLRSKENPNSGSATDYDINSPLSGMSQYPCKGALSYLGKPEGASVETYAPGGTYDMVIGSGAAHDGGSCQISLSYDKGKTFTVIKSIIGGCAAVGGSYKFSVPSDAPTGEAVFSWSWNNHSGNREFYQNCAVVTIAGSAQKRAPELFGRQQVAFSARPQIFVSNLGGEYCTPEGIDVVYPNPGPDVERKTTKPGNAKLCSTGAEVPAGGADSGSGSGNGGSGGGASQPAPTSAPVSTPASVKPTASPTSAPAQTAPVPSATAVIPPGGVFITVPVSQSAAPTTAAPTTLQTQTSAVASSVASAAPTSVTPPPSATSGGAPAPSPSSAPPAGGATGGLSGACTSEGEWNCIGGSSFQRCASGAWSAVIPMAAGTACQPGTSSSFVMKRVDLKALRARRVGVWN